MPQRTEIEIHVRFTDMDAQGVVNNSRYFDYFAEARLEHLRRLASVESTGSAGGGRTFTIAETTCRYRAPLRFRDQLKVACWTTEVRNRSFLLAYEIVRQDGTVAAEGTSAQVWLDSEQRAAALPDPVRLALESSLQ